MNLSFKTRIALYYMLATALVMAVVFGVVFFVVQGTVYKNLDQQLSFEAHKHSHEILNFRDSIAFKNMAEWEESEHREIQVNPVFIQLLNANGRLMDKSPNLKNNALEFNLSHADAHYNTFLESRAIRQVQIPIAKKGQTIGYIVAAVSLESSKMVLLSLRNVLLLSYLVVLVGLFSISRFLAGRSIAPIAQITETTNNITKNNMSARVVLPPNKDELHKLSAAINELLNRIEKALQRERQFTSDASHELRTPLAALRGTLEVLIRKPRTQEEYTEKIRYSLTEIDRMTATVEQLLHLARLASDDEPKTFKTAPILPLIEAILYRHKEEIERKNLRILQNDKTENAAMVPDYYANIILENIVTNALKYSNPNAEIKIDVVQTGNKISCVIQDFGIGIRPEEIEHIFQPFYRSDALDHKQITGNGLGLSIAKKAAEAISASLYLESELHKGTKITLVF